MPRFQASISADLREIADLLKPLGRYRSDSELLQGLLRYAALTQQPHTLSETWASLSLKEQDQLEARLLAGLKSKEPGRGSALKVLVYNTIKFMCGPDAKFPRVDEVLKALALGEEEYRRRQIPKIPTA